MDLMQSFIFRSLSCIYYFDSVEEIELKGPIPGTCIGKIAQTNVSLLKTLSAGPIPAH